VACEFADIPRRPYKGSNYEDHGLCLDSAELSGGDDGFG
jgi:hypothetical protein